MHVSAFQTLCFQSSLDSWSCFEYFRQSWFLEPFPYSSLTVVVSEGSCCVPFNQYSRFIFKLCRGVVKGNAWVPQSEVQPPPPWARPLMKWHFVQRSMKSRHVESRSPLPCSPLSPPCCPSFWKVWLCSWTCAAGAQLVSFILQAY